MAALLDCSLSRLPNQGLRKGVHTTDMSFSQHLCPGLLPVLSGHQDHASLSNPHSGQILALRNLANTSSPPAASLTSLMVRIHRGLLSSSYYTLKGVSRVSSSSHLPISDRAARQGEEGSPLQSTAPLRAKSRGSEWKKQSESGLSQPLKIPSVIKRQYARLFHIMPGVQLII